MSNTYKELEKALANLNKAISSQITATTSDAIQEASNRITASFSSLESAMTASLNEHFSIPLSLSSAFEDVMRNFNVAYSSLIKEASKGVKELFNSENSISDIPELNNGITYDYITINKTTIKEYEIPDTIAIPIGHNRVKIKTASFISIIGIIISIIISASAAIANHIDSASNAKDTAKLFELEVERNKLLQEQNQLLQNSLDSVDTSAFSGEDY